MTTRNNAFKEIPEYVVAADDKLAKKIAVFGDSHAGHLHPFFHYIGNREGWAIGNIKIPAKCHLPLTREGKAQPECESLLAQYEPYPIVMISMFYDLKRNNGPVPRMIPKAFFIEDFDQKFINLVTYFAKTKKVYVFADVKVADRSPLRSVFLEKYGLERFLKPIEELGNKAESNQHIFNLIKDIPNVQWVNPTKYLPKEYFINGIPLYIDQDHLNSFGSFYMAERFHKNERLLMADEVEKLSK
ncbi:SGNH hydrolase domain-containing protein [Moraxella sp. ZY200743]|uniref:SGNH hydrolase domain-containing protein n=1 Tax=Moraxella sp. ZY200743 TaxID=2911970 RepID=UPI003D7F0E05